MGKNTGTRLEDALGDPLLESKEKDVRIYGLVSVGRKIDIDGYVRSESREDIFHKVYVEYEPGSRNLMYGTCTCEAYRFIGNPCKHLLKLRNVFVKNERKLLGSVSSKP